MLVQARAPPQYIIEYLLEKAGIRDDVKIEYVSEHSEAAAKLASGAVDTILAPEPFVTSVRLKQEGLVTIDLTKAWEEAAGGESQVAMGCIVVRKEVAEKNKAALDAFLADYKASVEAVTGDLEKGAQLVVQAGIMEKEPAAKQAIPGCNIVYIGGADMEKTIAGFFDVLFAANPKALGGANVSSDFYYIG